MPNSRDLCKKWKGLDAITRPAPSQVASFGSTFLGMVVSFATVTVDSHIDRNACTAACIPLFMKRRSSKDGVPAAGHDGTGKPASAAEAMAELEFLEAAAAWVNKTMDMRWPA